MRDLHSNLKFVRTITARTASGTTDLLGADTDRQGFESVEHVVCVGASGDALSGSLKLDLILEHADADSSGAASTYSAVTNSDDVIGGTVDSNGIFSTIDSTTKDEAVFAIGYRGEKRYSRVKVDLTGTHTNGTPVAALIILGTPSLAPTV